MPAHHAHKAYLTAKVQQEVDPKRLILLLYEEALKQIRLTREGIQENNPRKRGKHLSRVLAIVSALQTALDSKVEDEPIAFLRGLYNAMLVELAKVSITHNVKTLDLAFRYLERLKEIWEQEVMGRKTGTTKGVLVSG
jgi:flagellar protein FliS